MYDDPDPAHPTMQVSHEDGRGVFLDALDVLMDVSSGLDGDRMMAASRCHGWSVADVLVHVHLGLQEMLVGIVSTTDAAPDTDAATYWRSQPPTNDADADRLAQIRFVRLLSAAYRRPAGLLDHLRMTASGVRTGVSGLRPGAVRFQGRVLATGDFLATWAVELAVHQLDLGRELDLVPPAPAALLLARATVESLAGSALPASWADERVVLLGTGRETARDDEARAAGPVTARLPVLG